MLVVSIGFVLSISFARFSILPTTPNFHHHQHRHHYRHCPNLPPPPATGNHNPATTHRQYLSHPAFRSASFIEPKRSADTFPTWKNHEQPSPWTWVQIRAPRHGVYAECSRKFCKKSKTPPEALERRHWYSDLEQALAVNLVKFSSKTVVI